MVTKQVFAKPVNKSEVVRQVLKDLGFMKTDVPTNWKNQTERALAKQNVRVHETMIYQLRKKYIAQNGEDKTTPAVQPTQVVTTPTLASLDKPILNLSDAKKIKEFVASYGGFDKCIEAIRAVKEIVEG